ncbi:MAG TPA: ABC transporter substrate-binding protein [Thermoanaerobaculia bacterium]|jgi:ABC-type transport system substrate-binding protein|nr:ABC transporter substrate-binding protein [Thermoanaerobaculia bacterium]
MADKTLRVGVLTPVNTLNPREAQDFTSVLAVEQIFETPFAQPLAAGEMTEPLLFAERLSPEGGDVYSARVRPGIFFSDGTPMTARHLADSLSRANTFREQATAEARDERVVFRLTRPNARFDLALARRFCGVMLETGGKLLGTGPYMPAPDSTPERTRLVRNPHYRKPAAIGEVVFQLYPPDAQGRPTALTTALEAGEADFSNILSREDIAQLKKVRRWTEPGSSTAVLYMNTSRPGLDDRRVRRAIALMIDRMEIAKMFFANALAFAASNLLPPMLGRSQDGLAYDPSQASNLMASAGSRKPARRLSLLLIYGPRPYLPGPQRVGEYIVAQLGRLGLAVDLVPTANRQEYFARVQRGEYDFALAGWIADTLDPVDFLQASLGSESIPSPLRKTTEAGNLSRLASPEMDETLARLREEPRDDLRAALLKKIGEEAPLLPLLYGATIFAHTWKLKGFKPSPLGKASFAELDLQE